MKKWIVAILAVVAFASCAGDKEVRPDSEGRTVTGIMAASGPQTLADNTQAEDITEVMTDNEFAEGSLLYISQMGTTLPPDFSEGSSNRYVYLYEENPLASWDAEGTYNFYPVAGTPAIEWDVVRNNGSVGNAFSLYAFHFPVENSVRFNIETDQRDLNNLKKSDILGAYHATSALFTRLRFRLYHLMVYLRVTLYVPVYEEDDDGMGYSGFESDAFRNAVVLNAATDFDIEWRTNRSSDTDPPLVILKQNSPRSMLRMYLHHWDEYPDNQEHFPVIEDFPVGKYYGDDPDATDKVRVYNFSVLFPGQTFGTSDNFLQFQFNTVGWAEGGDVKNFYFAASQLVAGSTEFNFTQGTLQQLNLYVPRRGNNTILVRANILPWTDASTDMTVTDQSGEPEDNDQVEED